MFFKTYVPRASSRFFLLLYIYFTQGAYIFHSDSECLCSSFRAPMYFIQGTYVLHSGHLYFIQDTYILHSGHPYFIHGAYNQIILHSGHLCTSFRTHMYFIQDTYVLHSGRLYIFTLFRAPTYFHSNQSPFFLGFRTPHLSRTHSYRTL